VCTQYGRSNTSAAAAELAELKNHNILNILRKNTIFTEHPVLE